MFRGYEMAFISIDAMLRALDVSDISMIGVKSSIVRAKAARSVAKPWPERM
jgi:hypothetical protein